MPHRGLPTVLLIDFDVFNGELSFRSISDDAFSRIDTKQKISKQDMVKICDRYWKFVDDSVIEGRVTLGGPQKLHAFYDRLVTHGTMLCRGVMSPDTCRQLFNVARQASVLIIITDLLGIPWEALFDPNQRCFLSDLCVLVRWPRHSQNSYTSGSRAEFTRRRVVCLDPGIDIDDGIKIEGCKISDYLRSHFGSDVFVTAHTKHMIENVKSARVIHWICEHASEGLRISEDVYYTIDDCEAHPFGRGAILILTSCRSGGSNTAEPSVASSICCASRCTVVAPSSLIATSVGVMLAKKIDEAIDSADKGTSLVDIWRKLHVSHEEINQSPRMLTPEACFKYWYGLYGDGEVKVKED